MKRILIVVAAMLPLITQAQDASTKQGAAARTESHPLKSTGFFTFNFGAAIPMGEFAEYSGKYAGYATTGFGGDMSLGIPFGHSPIGLVFKLSGYQIPTDVSAIKRANERDLPAGYTLAMTGDAPTYSIFNVTGGLLVTIPVKMISFDFRFLGGAMVSSFPEMHMSLSDGNGTTTNISASSETTVSGAYGGDFGIRFGLAKHFCLAIDAGGLYSAPTYDVSLGGKYVATEAHITVMHVTGGLGFLF